MKKTLFIALAVSVLALIVAGFMLWKGRSDDQLGSVTVGNEYNATTTPWNGVNVSHYLDKGYGALGSVIITKAGDTEFYLLNATNTP